MTGGKPGMHHNHPLALQRRVNKDKAAKLINEGLKTREVAERLGLAYTTVVKYREELLAEGLIQRKRKKR